MVKTKHLLSIVSAAFLSFGTACGDDSICDRTPAGIEVCRNGHDVNLEEVDFHYFDVEHKLGYSGTRVDLQLEIVPADCEIREDGSVGCYFEEFGIKYNGYFLAPRFIKIHLSNGDRSLEQSDYRFELNRYFKYKNGSDDWDCKEYNTPPPNCFDDFVK